MIKKRLRLIINSFRAPTEHFASGAGAVHFRLDPTLFGRDLGRTKNWRLRNTVQYCKFICKFACF